MRQSFGTHEKHDMAPEKQELHSNGPDIKTTVPKHKPMKWNILILKISSLGCVCMPFILTCFGRGVEKKAERQSYICKVLLTSRWHEAKTSSVTQLRDPGTNMVVSL